MSKHLCCNYLPGNNAAIKFCYEEESGKFWVSNDEYESRVNFCPFCGKQSSKLFKNSKEERKEIEIKVLEERIKNLQQEK